MESQKLTWTDKNGGWGLKNYDIRQAPGELMGALCKLRDYEMSNLDPRQLQAVDAEFSRQAKELMHYRELVKKGLLVELPCRPGDMLYRIDTDPNIFCGSPVPHTVDHIEIREDGRVLFVESGGETICDLESLQNGMPYLDYYRAFHTYSEAQRALEQLMESRTGQQPYQR